MQDRNAFPRDPLCPATLRVELGSALAAEAGPLQRRVGGLCDRLLAESGTELPPPIFVEAPWLRSHEYRIHFGDRQQTAGRAWPGRLRALGDPARLRRLTGRRDTEPFFGDPCVWIPPRQAAVARALGLLVADADQVIADHLERTLRYESTRQAAGDRVRALLRQVEDTQPSLVARASRRLGREHLQQVLSRLASDGLPSGALRHALERLTLQPTRSGTVENHAERLRIDLNRSLCHPLAHQGTLACITLDSEVQTGLFLWLTRGEDPREGERFLTHLASRLREGLDEIELAGQSPALLCLPSLRAALARGLGLALPGLRILKTEEMDPTLQLLDRFRIRTPGWPARAGLWFGLALLGADRRRQLRLELEEYERCLRRRALPLPTSGEGPAASPPRRNRPTPSEGRPPSLTPLQKAAVLLLECPTWVLRELLSRLQPTEVSRLSREMIRLGPRSQALRGRVLGELRGDTRGPLELRQLLDFLKVQMRLACQPETVISELGLCLAVLPAPLYHEVAGRVFAWLRMACAEDLRAELAGLRNQSDPQRAARALRRFVAFRRGGLHPLGRYGAGLLHEELQRAAFRNPQGLAAALDRLWLRPEEHVLEDFVRWCQSSPRRAARWLTRWAANWTAPDPDPEARAWSVLQALPPGHLDRVRRFLPAEIGGPPREGMPQSRDREESIRQCLEEYHAGPWTDSPPAGPLLN